MNSILLLIPKDCFFAWHYEKTQWQTWKISIRKRKRQRKYEPWECREYLLQTSVFHVKRPKFLQQTGRKISSKVMKKKFIFMCFMNIKSISQEVTMFRGYGCFKFWEYSHKKYNPHLFRSWIWWGEKNFFSCSTENGQSFQVKKFGKDTVSRRRFRLSRSNIGLRNQFLVKDELLDQNASSSLYLSRNHIKLFQTKLTSRDVYPLGLHTEKSKQILVQCYFAAS